jgi:hypothetical protein
MLHHRPRKVAHRNDVPRQGGATGNVLLQALDSHGGMDIHCLSPKLRVLDAFRLELTERYVLLDAI